MISQNILDEMQADLKELIQKEIRDRGLMATNLEVRHTDEDDETQDNTCITSEKPFEIGCTIYVNLDNTYDRKDIKALASQYVTYLSTSMKKDAFQLQIILNSVEKKMTKATPAEALNMAVEILKDCKRKNQEYYNGQNSVHELN